MALDDAGRWAALLAAAEEVDRTGEHYDAADCAVELADPELDLARDSVLLLDGDAPVASQLLLVRGPAGARTVHVDGVVHPAHRGRGIGAALLDRARRRAAELGAELQIRVSELVPGAVGLVESAGLTAVRWWWELRRDLTAPTAAVELPPGLALTSLGPVYDPASWDEPLRVARNESFAAATARTGHRDLYVATVGTVPAWRGRGVAAALLAHALDRARARGYATSSLHVDAQNPTGALGVYRRAGYRTASRQITFALPPPS